MKTQFHIEGNSLQGIEDFMFSLGENCKVEVKTIKKTGWFFRTYYFELQGTFENLGRFFTLINAYIKEYNK